jgi:hypothetical protein
MKLLAKTWQLWLAAGFFIIGAINNYFAGNTLTGHFFLLAFFSILIVIRDFRRMP